MRRLWLLIAGLLLGGAAMQALFVDTLRSAWTSSLLVTAAFGVAFVVGEACVAHVTTRHEAHTFGFSEIPFVVGLFVIAPREVVLARVAGGALALAWHRRQSLVKFTFNVAQWWFGSAAGVVTWHLICGNGDPDASRSWVAAIVATLIAAAASGLAIAAVMNLRGAPNGLRGLPIGLITSAANATFAIVAIAVVRTDWRGAWVIAIVAALVALSQRVQVALMRRHDSVQRLQSFTQRIASSDLQLDVVVADVLAGTRDLLEVATTRLELSELDGDCVQAWVCDNDGVRRTTPSATAMLAATPHASRRMAVETLSVLLYGTDGAMGALSVSGRLGDVDGLHASDVQLLEAVAGHAAVALHNGRLADRLRDQVA